jgi:hypothetical protein
MRWRFLFLAVFVGALAGCAGQASIRPAEVLDEQTGITSAALREPIEFVQSAASEVVVLDKQHGFAYLGPVEWDRSGNISYGLWLQVVPGNDGEVADIRAVGAVTLILDDGPVILSPTDAPKLGQQPYGPVVSWGQTAYFELSPATLARMAASQKLALEFRGVGSSKLSFTPTHAVGDILAKYARGRGIIHD